MLSYDVYFKSINHDYLLVTKLTKENNYRTRNVYSTLYIDISNNSIQKLRKHRISNCIYLFIIFVTGFLVKNESSLKYELAKRRPDLMDHISWNKPNVKSTRNGITGTLLYESIYICL